MVTAPTCRAARSRERRAVRKGRSAPCRRINPATRGDARRDHQAAARSARSDSAWLRREPDILVAAPKTRPCRFATAGELHRANSRVRGMGAALGTLPMNGRGFMSADARAVLTPVSISWTSGGHGDRRKERGQRDNTKPRGDRLRAPRPDKLSHHLGFIIELACPSQKTPAKTERSRGNSTQEKKTGATPLNEAVATRAVAACGRTSRRVTWSSLGQTGRVQSLHSRTSRWLASASAKHRPRPEPHRIRGTALPSQRVEPGGFAVIAKGRLECRRKEGRGTLGGNKTCNWRRTSRAATSIVSVWVRRGRGVRDAAVVGGRASDVARPGRHQNGADQSGASRLVKESWARTSGNGVAQRQGGRTERRLQRGPALPGAQSPCQGVTGPRQRPTAGQNRERARRGRRVCGGVASRRRGRASQDARGEAESGTRGCR